MTSGLRPEACKGSLLQAGLIRLPLGASCAEKASVVAGVEERNDITERSSSDPGVLPQHQALQPLV